MYTCRRCGARLQETAARRYAARLIMHIALDDNPGRMPADTDEQLMASLGDAICSDCTLIGRVRQSRALFLATAPLWLVPFLLYGFGVLARDYWRTYRRQARK